MRILTRIPWILLLLLLIGAVWCLRPVSDTDILWHLRTGQWMLAHGDVIRHDVFSATRLGSAWVSVPWLYELMLAKLNAATGWCGITLWQALMLMAITLQTSLLVWLLRRHSSSDAASWNWKWPYLSVPAALAVLLTLRLLQMRINCRPEWFSYLFIGSFLVLLTVATQRSEVRDQRSVNPEYLPPTTQHLSLLLWLLPLLQMLWTNTHGAFIIGPLLVWGYAAAAWAKWLLAKNLAKALSCACGARGADALPAGSLAQKVGTAFHAVHIRLTVAAMLTTLACLTTPYGLAGTFYPFHLFHVLNDPLYKNGIVEAQPVDLTMVLESGSLGYALLACWVFAGLGLLGRLLEGLQEIAEVQGSGFRVQGCFSPNSWLRTFVSGPRTSNTNPPTLNPEPRTLENSSTSQTNNLPLGYLFACAAMAYLSLSAIRNVPLFPLVVAPLVASGIEYAADGLAAVVAKMLAMRSTPWRRRQRSEVRGQAEPRTRNPEPCLSPAERGVARLHSRPAHILAHVLLALGLLFTYRAIVSERFYTSLGWRMRFAIGYSDHEHPLAACDFVTRHRAEISCRTLYGDTRSANLFLARFGPQWPVYFDGRHAEIYDPPIFRTAARTRGNPALFDQEAAAYGIGLVCFSLTDLKEDRSPLAVTLGQTNTWRLVYLDDCAALFAANTPTNAPFVARYGLPCAPTNATLQRALFADWLTRQGRANLAALHDPTNQSLETAGFAGELIHTLQLGGFWASTRSLEPLRFCRLASFLDHLGWTMVADDFYQQALRWPDPLRQTLPRAIRHAQKILPTVTDSALQAELRRRIRGGAEELQRLDPGNLFAEEAMKEGELRINLKKEVEILPQKNTKNAKTKQP